VATMMARRKMAKRVVLHEESMNWETKDYSDVYNQLFMFYIWDGEQRRI
jgi:hypothetical protein